MDAFYSTISKQREEASHNTQKNTHDNIMYGINQVTIICQKVYPRAKKKEKKREK